MEDGSRVLHFSNVEGRCGKPSGVIRIKAGNKVWQRINERKGVITIGDISGLVVESRWEGACGIHHTPGRGWHRALRICGGFWDQTLGYLSWLLPKFRVMLWHRIEKEM